MKKDCQAQNPIAMLELALGPHFNLSIQKGGGTVIDTIDRSLAELALAGIYAARQENVFLCSPAAHAVSAHRVMPSGLRSGASG